MVFALNAPAVWWALGHARDPGFALWPLSLLLAVNVALLVWTLTTDGRSTGASPIHRVRLVLDGLAVLLLSQAVVWWLSLHVQAAVLIPPAIWSGSLLARRASGARH